jgi:hypothetical protein
MLSLETGILPMKKLGLLLALLSMLPGGSFAAEPPKRDYLADTYQFTQMPARFFLLYDECVGRGYIDDNGLSAIVRFQSAVDRGKINYDKYRPPGISGDDVAAAKRRSIEDAKQSFKLHPPKPDKSLCELIQRTMPDFAKKYDIQ